MIIEGLLKGKDTNQKSPLKNNAFILIFIIAFLNYNSSQMLSLTLPKFANEMGASAQAVGLLAGIFAMCALIMRPISGQIVDNENRLVLLRIVLSVMLVSVFGLTLSNQYWMLLVFRGLNGLGWGVGSTLCMTIATDCFSTKTMATGIGIYGLGQTMAQTLAPMFALPISLKYGYNTLYYINVALLIICLILTLFMKLDSTPPKMKSYSINIKNMIYFPAISPAILTMCNAIAKSSVTAFLVIFAGTMDVKNIGLYFTIQAATIFVFRPLVSNMADRLGTLKVLIPCEIINVIALIIISISRSLPMFLFAAVLMGISIAGEQPILMAECVKTADRSKRGSASNTSNSEEEKATEKKATVTTDEDSGTESTEGPNTICVGINSDPGSLNPFSGSGNGVNSTFPVIYEALADPQWNCGPIEGVIAKEWEKVGDLTYHIKIHDYVYDSAGNHITADDVAWCYNMTKEAGAHRNLRYLQRMDVVDEYTVELEITSDVLGIFEKVISDVKIVSKAAYEADSEEFASNPISTSPYKVVEFIPGSKIVLEKNDNYWQTDESLITNYQKANVDRIEFNIIKEESQMVVALETGTIDMVSGLSAKNAARFENDPDYNIFVELQNLSQVMFFNCHPDNPFNSKELRQAVLYAIDIQGLIKGAADGQAIPCSTFGGNMFSDYNPEWEKTKWYEYNIVKAQELLAEAGYQPGELTVRMVSNGNAIRKKIGQIMQGYLGAIGINVEIIDYEDALFNTYKYEPGEWDILLDNCGSSDYLVTLWRGKFDPRQFENGGAKGIALINDSGSRLSLRHVFDVSDTNSRYNRPVVLWSLREEYSEDVTETLENAFGDLKDKSNVPAALISAAFNAVEDNFPDYLSDLMYSRENSFLEELDDLNVEVIFKNALRNSVAYMLLVRCGYPADEFFSFDDFQSIINFNTLKTISGLGAATSDISEMILKEISATVKSIQRTERNQNRTFAKSQDIRHNKSEYLQCGL
jgi:ABC-type transport system substrate-binding protein/nitrate/nitrite transporter NarK